VAPLASSRSPLASPRSSALGIGGASAPEPTTRAPGDGRASALVSASRSQRYAEAAPTATTSAAAPASPARVRTRASSGTTADKAERGAAAATGRSKGGAPTVERDEGPSHGNPCARAAHSNESNDSARPGTTSWYPRSSNSRPQTVQFTTDEF
jgi:hypothetical protein